ncbi:MAG: hypothetical protein WC931_04100 [Bacilli bacterium]
MEDSQVGIIKAAFGAKNRARLIDQYFTQQKAPANLSAWEHVYRLLLWVDQTTGLAHCYESDKCQPGKNWYARSLAFHDWVSTALGMQPALLGEEIDWLFRRATADLVTAVLSRANAMMATAARQRAPYNLRGFPRPGEDPELVSIVKEVLGDNLCGEPTPEKWQLLVQRIRQYLALENKRKNLVGEGFEDVLAAAIKRSLGGALLDIRTRNLLHELPGFNRARKNDKPNKVDLAIIQPSGVRTLVTVKWSLRADREKQFSSEFSEYVQAESDRQPFEYVFVTNEFDPARLMRACESLAGNTLMFTHVVHINTDALKATYGDSQEKSQRKVIDYINAGRLIGLGKWMELVTTPRP